MRRLFEVLVVAVVSVICAVVLHRIMHTPVVPVAGVAFVLGLVAR